MQFWTPLRVRFCRKTEKKTCLGCALRIGTKLTHLDPEINFTYYQCLLAPHTSWDTQDFAVIDPSPLHPTLPSQPLTGAAGGGVTSILEGKDGCPCVVRPALFWQGSGGVVAERSQRDDTGWEEGWQPKQRQMTVSGCLNFVFMCREVGERVTGQERRIDIYY